MSDKYFTGLNYTLGNEDTSLEVAVTTKFLSKKILSVCGSGGRSFPLVNKSTEKISLIDLSGEQLMLAELRQATYSQFEYQDFLLFWGYFPYDDKRYCEQRKKLFAQLQLSAAVRRFFEHVFTQLHFQGLLYLGKWERTFQIFARINKFVLGDDYDKLLRFDNLDEQKNYYFHKFSRLKFNLVLGLVGNKPLFNALLYKGHFIEKNSELSHFKYYQKAYENLFTNDIASKSFFLQLCFYGKIRTLEGNPIEASEEQFNKIKAYNKNIFYINENIVDHLSSAREQYDFISLSDVPSYFKGELETNFMQAIRPGLMPGAIVVNRYYLRTPDCDLSGYTDITAEFSEVIRLEKVQMYNIKIYRYRTT